MEAIKDQSSRDMKDSIETFLKLLKDERRLVDDPILKEKLDFMVITFDEINRSLAPLIYQMMKLESDIKSEVEDDVSITRLKIVNNSLQYVSASQQMVVHVYRMMSNIGINFISILKIYNQYEDLKVDKKKIKTSFPEVAEQFISKDESMGELMQSINDLKKAKEEGNQIKVNVEKMLLRRLLGTNKKAKEIIKEKTGVDIDGNN